MGIEIPDQPRALRSPEAISARKGLLDEPHMRPLSRYVSELRKSLRLEVPDFDPLDGGINAELLFVFRKPGRMTSETGECIGSGFISRDNNDDSAEQTFNFMTQALIPRERTVLWNIIPSWNGIRPITGEEMRVGLEELPKVLVILNRLRGVVLAGKDAHKAEGLIRQHELPVFKSALPSPLGPPLYREQWERIPEEWAEAGRSLGIQHE